MKSSTSRNLYILAGSIILGFALLIIGAWLTVQLEPGTAAHLTYVPYWRYLPFIRHNNYVGSDAGPMLLFYQFLILYPLIAATVGLFVGWFVYQKAWLLAAISLIPVLTLQTVGWSWRGEIGVRFTILSYIVYFGAYIVMAMIVAYGMSRWREKRLPPQRRMSNEIIQPDSQPAFHHPS